MYVDKLPEWGLGFVLGRLQFSSEETRGPHISTVYGWAQCFENLSMPQITRGLLDQIAGSCPHSFSFCKSGVGQEMCISSKFSDDADLTAQGPPLRTSTSFVVAFPKASLSPRMTLWEDMEVEGLSWRVNDFLLIYHGSDIITENIFPYWQVWCCGKLKQEAQHRW